jgi:hypothetical protein
VIWPRREANNFSQTGWTGDLAEANHLRKAGNDADGEWFLVIFSRPLAHCAALGFTEASGSAYGTVILANSFVALFGALYTGQAPTADAWLYALVALAGAMIGTTVGLRWLSQNMPRHVPTAILGTAGLQLLFFQIQTALRLALPLQEFRHVGTAGSTRVPYPLSIVDSGPQGHYAYWIHNPQWG